MAGVPLSRVSELLGHSTIALTQRYAEFAPGSARDAVEKLVPR
jgi:site-specific recombinase XerD